MISSRQVVVSGAAGYVGGAVARALLSSGRSVVGVVRRAEQGLDLVGRGADVLQADIGTEAGVEVLRRALSHASGYVHAATVEPKQLIKLVTVAAQALPGDDLPVVLLQGALVYGDTGPTSVEETVEPDVPPFLLDASAAEAHVLNTAGARPVSVRLANVYGGGGGAITSRLLAAARVDQIAGYPGSGGNVWSAIHVEDAAQLVTLAVTNPGLTGAINGRARPHHATARRCRRRFLGPVRNADEVGLGGGAGTAGILRRAVGPGPSAIVTPGPKSWLGTPGSRIRRGSWCGRAFEPSPVCRANQTMNGPIMAGDASGRADTPHKNAVVRLISEVYVGNDQRTIEELIHPDIRNYTLNPTNDGVEQFKAVMRWVHSVFAELTWTIDDLIEDGDRVVFRGTMTGTHRAPVLGVPATGRRVSEEHIEIFGFRDGKIIERRAQRDQLGMLAQLTAP